MSEAATTFISKAEMEAHGLMRWAEGCMTTADSIKSDADYIVALAERITAARKDHGDGR